MMAWNLFVIFAAAAFGFYVGENKRTIKGEKLFFVVCAGVALLWCAHRYSWEEIADSKRAYLSMDGARRGSECCLMLQGTPRRTIRDETGIRRFDCYQYDPGHGP